MRLQPKYKVYKQLKTLVGVETFPLNYFKNKKLRNYLYFFGTSSKKNVLKCLNINQTRIRRGRFESKRRAYSTNLMVIRIYKQYFHSIFRLAKIKAFLFNARIVTKWALLQRAVVRPLFRLDIFLTTLYIFKSVYAARQIINCGFVLVNGVVVFANYQLQKNDIITFNSTDSYTHIINRIIRQQALGYYRLFNFIEYDYYTKSFIILRDYRTLSLVDISLFRKSGRLDRLLTYCRSK